MCFSRDSAIDVRFALIDRCELLLAAKYKKDAEATVPRTVTARKERPILLAIFIKYFRIYVVIGHTQRLLRNLINPARKFRHFIIIESSYVADCLAHYEVHVAIE